MACDKEEEKELSFWDKIIAEMGETKLSAMDVLKSLQDNEYWNIIIEYHYYRDKIGKVEEMDYSKTIPGNGKVTYRFNEDICTSYCLHNSLGYSQLDCVDYTIKGDDLNFVCSINDKELCEWEIVAYDENQVLVKIYQLDNQQIGGPKTLLYKKLLLSREIDYSQWWVKAVPDGQE